MRGHDVDDDPIKFTDEEEVELSRIWFEITSEYNELFGEKVNGNNYIVVAQVSEMAQELEIVSTLLGLYELRPSERLREALEKWRYDANDFESCDKKLKALKFRMEFTTSKNKELFDDKPIEEQKKYKVYDDVVSLENSMGITIDVHKTVLEKWAALIMKNDDLVKAQRQKVKK